MQEEVDRVRQVLDSILPRDVIDSVMIRYLIHRCELCFKQLDERTLSCLKEAKISSDLCEACLGSRRSRITLRKFWLAKYSFDCIQCGDRVPWRSEVRVDSRCDKCYGDQNFHEVRQILFGLPAIGAGLLAGAAITGLAGEEIYYQTTKRRKTN